MDIFTKFKQALKIREVLVDNNVFQLHYRVTALLLLCCAGLVASKQHFGDPIDCITRDDVPNKIMDTYCWIHATFTLPSACNKTVGVEVAHPCVDKYSHDNEERIYHKYYQWVYFVLFFQAAFFYAPHFFWKAYEAKLLTRLTGDFKDPFCDEEDKDRRGKATRVAQYLERHRRGHQKYYSLFTLFEAANLLNVVGQMYVVNEFLGGTFTSYGLDVIQYAQMDQESRVDPMVKVFPRMTKCTFHRFGSSGDVQTYDALCILPLNIINEKIYIIMWFWFVLLAAITTLWLIYRALTFIRPNLRLEVLKRRASFTDEEKLRFVLKYSKTGDWFLLCMMCKNMEAQWFSFVIDKYSKLLEKTLLEEEEERKRQVNNHSNSSRKANNKRRQANLAKGRSSRNGRGDGRQPMLKEMDDDMNLDHEDEHDLSDLESGRASTFGSVDRLRESVGREPFDGVAVVPPSGKKA